jgi:hypothetical protein
MSAAEYVAGDVCACEDCAHFGDERKAISRLPEPSSELACCIKGCLGDRVRKCKKTGLSFCRTHNRVISRKDSRGRPVRVNERFVLSVTLHHHDPFIASGAFPARPRRASAGTEATTYQVLPPSMQDGHIDEALPRFDGTCDACSEVGANLLFDVLSNSTGVVLRLASLGLLGPPGSAQ